MEAKTFELNAQRRFPSVSLKKMVKRELLPTTVTEKVELTFRQMPFGVAMVVGNLRLINLCRHSFGSSFTQLIVLTASHSD